MMDKPTFITDPTYKQWVNDIERRFRSQQIKAVVQVNSCKIEFYWSIGRDICEMNVEQRYGDGVIKTLSQDLRMKIPEVKGLTPGGLYYCKRFYLLYNKVFEIFPQLGVKSVPQLGEILTPLHSVSTDTNTQPLGNRWRTLNLQFHQLKPSPFQLFLSRKEIARVRPEGCRCQSHHRRTSRAVKAADPLPSLPMVSHIFTLMGVCTWEDAGRKMLPPHHLPKVFQSFINHLIMIFRVLLFALTI